MERRILLVDSEKQSREFYLQAFSRANYAVTTAKSADEALEIFKKKPYGVLFLDLDTPGMNGIDLCRKIRKRFSMVIPYAVTGHASLFEHTDYRDAGFENYFTKPTNLLELLEVSEYAFKKLERWKK